MIILVFLSVLMLCLVLVAFTLRQYQQGVTATLKQYNKLFLNLYERISKLEETSGKS